MAETNGSTHLLFLLLLHPLLPLSFSLSLTQSTTNIYSHKISLVKSKFEFTDIRTRADASRFKYISHKYGSLPFADTLRLLRVQILPHLQASERVTRRGTSNTIKQEE